MHEEDLRISSLARTRNDQLPRENKYEIACITGTGKHLEKQKKWQHRTTTYTEHTLTNTAAPGIGSPSLSESGRYLYPKTNTCCGGRVKEEGKGEASTYKCSLCQLESMYNLQRFMLHI